MPTTNKETLGIVPTQRAAATRLKVTTKTIRSWRAEGAPGFESDGSINLHLLVEWVEKRRELREGSSSAKDEKTLEEIRKLRLANDRVEGRLVDRAWVAGRIQKMFGDVNAFRIKSEAEHPTKFAAAAGDVPLCRTYVRGIWDQIITDLQSLHKHLEDGPAE